MFHEVVAHDDVEVVVFIWDLMHIEVHVCPRRNEVRSDNLQSLGGIESLQKTVFRGEVQHAAAGTTIEHVAVLGQVHPHRPVTFEAQAIWRQRVGATPVRAAV